MLPTQLSMKASNSPLPSMSSHVLKSTSLIFTVIPSGSSSAAITWAWVTVSGLSLVTRNSIVRSLTPASSSSALAPSMSADWNGE